MSVLMRGRIVTLLIGVLGAIGFWLLGLPLPFLFGPMAFCLAAALGGVRLVQIGAIGPAARTVLGVAVGASVTPALLAQVPQMMASVALVPIYIVVIGLVGVPFFRKLGFDPVTSWYAAMPGSLQDMVTFGVEAGGDARALSLIHATRLLILLAIAPLVLVVVYDAGLTGPIGDSASTLPPSEMGLMGLAALGGWKVAERIGLFGATILGPMIVTAALSLAGIIHSRPPAEALLTAQLFIGIGIGAHYVGVTLRELRNTVAAGIGYVLLLAVLAAAFSEMVILLGLAGPLDAFLAFAPGGQAEMALLAIVMGADLGYIVLHHLTRIVLVILGAPIAARLMRVRK